MTNMVTPLRPAGSFTSYGQDIMRSLRVVVALGVLLLTLACGDGYSTPSPSPSPTPAPGGTGSSVMIPRGAESLGNRAYAPAELDVTAGTTVTWTNTDATAHTSTSNTPGWDSGIVAPGGQFSFAFQNTGSYSYHCAIHPGMTGTVVVR